MCLLKTEVQGLAFCMGVAGLCSGGLLEGRLGEMLEAARLQPQVCLLKVSLLEDKQNTKFRLKMVISAGNHFVCCCGCPKVGSAVHCRS